MLAALNQVVSGFDYEEEEEEDGEVEDESGPREGEEGQDEGPERATVVSMTRFCD